MPRTFFADKNKILGPFPPVPARVLAVKVAPKIVARWPIVG